MNLFLQKFFYCLILQKLEKICNIYKNIPYIFLHNVVLKIYRLIPFFIFNWRPVVLGVSNCRGAAKGDEGDSMEI